MIHIAQANLAIQVLDHLRCMEWGPVMPEWDRDKSGRSLTPGENLTKDVALTTLREFLNQDLFQSHGAAAQSQPQTPNTPPATPPSSPEIPSPQPRPTPTDYPWPKPSHCGIICDTHDNNPPPNAS